MSALPNPSSGGAQIDAMIAAVVRGVKNGTRTSVSTKREAALIVTWFQQRAPQELVDYFERELVDLVAQKMQHGMARSRQAGRRSAFAAYAAGETPSPAAEVFTRQYACADGVWRRTADMTAQDWRHIVESRAVMAKASMFEIAFAHRVLKKLPNDTATTGSVLTEKQLEQLEQQAEKDAHKAISAFMKPTGIDPPDSRL